LSHTDDSFNFTVIKDAEAIAWAVVTVSTWEVVAGSLVLDSVVFKTSDKLYGACPNCKTLSMYMS